MFRQLTDEEKQELAEHLLQNSEGFLGDTIEEVLQGMESYPITAYDDYISDSVGYAGKFIFCMWGFPEAYEVYIFPKSKGGKIEKINTELNQMNHE